MTPEEAYRVLELEPGSPAEAVQEAYRQAALRTHPDRAQGYGLHDKKAWLKVRDAYECLRTAGFPALPPPEAPASKEPKRYRAPEWLERQWANQQPERFSDHLAMDDHESYALRKTIGWILFIAIGLFLTYWIQKTTRQQKQWAPRSGVQVRW